ncbi:MAG: hypothetical protein JWM95_255 [Gemmatimonadetes bacterium]|nr:hypothetical protein [Gemmatimonadota bacterium]
MFFAASVEMLLSSCMARSNDATASRYRLASWNNLPNAVHSADVCGADAMARSSLSRVARSPAPSPGAGETVSNSATSDAIIMGTDADAAAAMAMG